LLHWPILAQRNGIAWETSLAALHHKDLA
jgi:hypothetical protein